MKSISIEIPEKDCEGCRFLGKTRKDNCTCVLFDVILENYPDKCLQCKLTSKKILLENK